MSISIVSANPSPPPTPTSGAESAGEGVSGGLTFASLLLSQRTAALLTGTADSSLPSDETALSGDAGTSDAAAVLASLGILGQELRTTGATSAETKNTSEISKIGGTSQPTSTPAQLARERALNLTDEANASEFESFAEEVGIQPTDKKPANIAALRLDEPKDELTASNTKASESTIGTPIGLTNTNTLSGRHDSSLAISTHIRDQSWAQDFTQKISWLASNDKQSAQITLNPDQMGPIEISLNIDKGSATASFVSANAEVRDAIETAMPRLREMFASAGIELGQTNVSAESFRQQTGANEESTSRGESRKDNDNAILGTDSTLSPRVRAFASQRGNGMVDIFA